MEKEIKTTRHRKGWLLPYLLKLDYMFFKRWDYWTRICISDKIPEEPIPLIRFRGTNHYHQKLVNKNIEKCLNYANHTSYPLDAFIDWILWGFNKGDNFPEINPKVDDFWYRTFNLGLFYQEPADHWSDIVTEYMGRHKSLGFFPTPANVIQMITQMTFGGEPKPEHKTKSVCDPCCGTGNMLLYASNYSLNLYGNDISNLLTKIALINSYIYMPWIVYRPNHLTIFDKIEQPAISEIELPTGIKIPKCNICGNSTSFLVEMQTQHELSVINGLISIDKPNISKDLISKKLKPENISCANCIQEFEKESVL